jgi:triacylglycerol lipase
VRAFIEVVIKYTGAEKVNVVSHSMGVTITRRALKGGYMQEDEHTKYYVGEPLTDKVYTFIGIAGCNHGCSLCAEHPQFGEGPICNTFNGLGPALSSEGT